MPPPCSWRVSYRAPSWSRTATPTASGRSVRTTQLPSPAGWAPSTRYGSCDQPSTIARRSSPLTSARTPMEGLAGGVVASGSTASTASVVAVGSTAVGAAGSAAPRAGSGAVAGAPVESPGSATGAGGTTGAGGVPAAFFAVRFAGAALFAVVFLAGAAFLAAVVLAAVVLVGVVVVGVAFFAAVAVAVLVFFAVVFLAAVVPAGATSVWSRPSSVVIVPS